MAVDATTSHMPPPPSPTCAPARSRRHMHAQGEDYMVPFSPDRPSAASDVAASPDEKRPSGESGVTTMTPQEVEPPPEAVVGDVEQSSATDTPTPPASTTGSAAKHAGGGGIRSGSLLAEWATVNEFIFSDDDEDEAEENAGAGRGTTTPERSSQQRPASVDDPKGIIDGAGVDEGDSTCAKGTSGDERASGGRKDGRDPVGREGERPRAKGGITKEAFDEWSSSSSSSDDGNDDPRRKEPVNGGTHSRDRHEALMNSPGFAQGERPDGSGGDGNDDEALSPPTPEGGRGVVGSACATPAPGAWSAPDFGFSSDDDLDIEFSASERSLERPAGR